MAIPTIKVHSADKTVQIIDNLNPLPVTVCPGGLGEVSASNPLPVESDGTTIVVTPTVTAGAYSAGDCIAGTLTFANAARVLGSGGVVKDVVIVDDAGQDVSMELWLFSTNVISPGDNAAWACPEASLHYCVGIIPVSTWYATGTPSVAMKECSVRYDLPGGTSLFGQLVTRGTPTFAATDDVTVIIGVLRD